MTMKFLLLDDDVIFNYLHDQVIHIANPESEVLCMDSCAEALQMLADDKLAGRPFPDCILLDINMPEMTGFEFLDAFSMLLEGTEPQTAVFMVTSSLNDKDLTKAMSYSCVKGFRDKPLSTTHIGQIIETIQSLRV